MKGRIHHGHGGELHAHVKGHSMKHVKHRKAGGRAESPEHGVDEAMEDLHHKNIRYTGGKPEDEAEAMHAKRGGRAKRKHGGHVKHHAAGGMAKHHEHGKHLAHAKHVGPVTGHKAVHHAGRKPRARGGADMNPLSSAHAGTPPRGHKDRDID